MVKKSVFSKSKSHSLIGGFLVVSFLTILAGANAGAIGSSSQQFTAEVVPAIAISAPDGVQLNFTPTHAGAFESKRMEVEIFTNATAGYELYFSSEDEETDLKHTDIAISNVIPSSFTGPLTSNNLPNNNWGYSLENVNFNPIPKKSAQAKIKHLDVYPNSENDRIQKLYLGLKADASVPSGVYQKKVMFTAIAHENPIPPKGIFTINNMQEMTSNICNKNTTPNNTATQLDTDGSHHGDPNYVPTKTLTDTRDNNTYTVSKLADGKCWMTQNLRIAGKTLTPADSDVTSNYTIPASSLSGFDNYDTSNAYVDNTYGGYYNWYTATAGTGTTSLSTEYQNTTVSICPKGWKLPTSGNSNSDFQILYNNYDSSSALISSLVNLTLSGLASSSSMGAQGSGGYYWSSTVYSSNRAYHFYLNSSGIRPSVISDKDGGFSVRCVAR